MSKIIFTCVIIALVAAILSLSTIATAFADDGGTGGNRSPSDDDNGAHQPQQVSKISDYSSCS